MGQLFNIRFHQGRLDEVTDELAAAADAYPRHRGVPGRDGDRGDRARPPRAARPSLDAVFGPGGIGVPDDLNWLTTIAFATHAAARAR